jgi:hypothetical protein
MFTLVPSGHQARFAFSDMVISREYWIYSVYEFGIIILLTGVIANEATEYKRELQIFFGLMVADMFDWIICYNEAWFHIGTFPISMNILKCLIFGLTILNAWIKNSFK